MLLITCNMHQLNSFLFCSVFYLQRLHTAGMICLCCLFLSITPVTAQEVPGELLVWWKSKATADSSLHLLQVQQPELSLRNMAQLSRQPFIQRLRYNVEASASLPQLLETLHANPAAQWVQANHYIQWRHHTPNDPLFASKQKHLQHIGAPQAWKYSTGGISPNGDTIVVAIIDSGCDFDHEDLQGNLWYNWADPLNGIDDDNNGYIDDWRGWDVSQNDNSHSLGIHGTPVAGIIGARGDNGKGIAGINWNSKIMVLSGTDNGPGNLTTEATVVQAYSYILDMRRRYNQSNGTEGAYVVATNASFGVNNARAEDFPIWCALYDTLGKEGILNIGATANNGVNVDAVGDMPSTCPSDFLLTVTNTTLQDRLNPAAGFGSKHIDIGAPGNGTWSTRIFDNYSAFGGTSAAAPLVTGSVALLYAYDNPWWATLQKENPQEAAQLAKKILLKAAFPMEDLKERSVSGGRLNAGALFPTLQKQFAPINEGGELRIYPNPSRTTLHFEVDVAQQGNYRIQVFNAIGQLQYQATWESTHPQRFSQDLLCQDWSQGVYILRIEGPRQSWEKRFLKF